MGGFKSDMEGTKALYLEDYCKSNDIDFIRFDYSGHGQSSGRFTDGTIGIWKQDAIGVLDGLTEKPQILIGSSLGGWISMLTAIERPKKLYALIGIAAAPDFTEDLIWDKLSESEKEILKKEGLYNLPSEYCNDPTAEPDPYPITYNLITEARERLLLRGKIEINCPVRLIHGIKDLDVPYETCLRISENITSEDVRIILSKNGDHRMSSPESLEIIKNTIEQFLCF